MGAVNMALVASVALVGAYTTVTSTGARIAALACVPMARSNIIVKNAGMLYKLVHVF
jgi:hypothetical protein